MPCWFGENDFASVLSENQAGETVRYLDFLILVRLGVLAARCVMFLLTLYLCEPLSSAASFIPEKDLCYCARHGLNSNRFVSH